MHRLAHMLVVDSVFGMDGGYCATRRTVTFPSEQPTRVGRSFY